MTARSTDLATHEFIELVRFSMLGCWAGVVAAQVSPVRADADSGEAVAIETLAGMAPGKVAKASKRVLLKVLAGNGQGAGVLVGVQTTADLVRMPCAAVHPLPALLRARNRLVGLRALGWMDDGRDDPLVLMFDWCSPDVPGGG